MQSDLILPTLLILYPAIVVFLAANVIKSPTLALSVALITGVCLQIVDYMVVAPHAPWYYLFNANFVVVISWLCFFARPIRG